MDELLNRFDVGVEVGETRNSSDEDGTNNAGCGPKLSSMLKLLAPKRGLTFFF